MNFDVLTDLVHCVPSRYTELLDESMETPI